MKVKAVAIPSGGGQVAGTPKAYGGFALRETSAISPATVRIWDSATAASGVPLDTIALMAGESAREYYADGIVSDGQTGVWAEILSGTVAGSIRIEA